MRLKRSEILRLAKGLISATDSARECDRAAEQLLAAVDAAVAGEDVAEAFPELAAHLELCGACRCEFDDLLEVARAAEAGALPQLAQLPHFDWQRISQQAEAPLPLEHADFRARFRRYLKQVRAGLADSGQEIVRGLASAGASLTTFLVGPDEPALQTVPVRSRAPSAVQQRDYSIEPLGLVVTLKIREFDRRRFTVRGLIEGAQSLEGMGVSLLSSPGGEPLDCTRLDSTDTFSFHDVGPGSYQIRLDVTETEGITLTGVDI